MQIISEKPGVEPQTLELQTQYSFPTVQLLLPRTWEGLDKYFHNDSLSQVHGLSLTPSQSQTTWPHAKATAVSFTLVLVLSHLP